MALGEVRQARLDVFCHCCRLLLEYLDSLEGAFGEYDDWSGYRLVRECVDSTANLWGSTPSEVVHRQALCGDFLRRVRGAMQQKLPADSPAFAAFADYAAAVQDASDIPCADLTEWQCVGEELSRACYCYYLPNDAPALCLLVEPVALTPTVRSKPDAVPKKTEGRGEIVFGFAADCFVFADYVNLPFFFLHEYLSHLHSALMFAEHYGSQDHPFTEGWLLYYARLFYLRTLFHETHLVLHHPLHKEHYMERYLQDTLDEKERPMICKGYELARQFCALMGETRFEQITLLVASTPYDVFTPQAPDLHGEFVKRIHCWLRRTATLPPQERENRVAALDAVLDGYSPVRGLMEWLIQ